jgi:hypothetical protein
LALKLAVDGSGSVDPVVIKRLLGRRPLFGRRPLTIKRSVRTPLRTNGKSQPSHTISQRTSWPILSLDTIKNPFLQHIEDVDRPCNRILGKASYQAIFSVIRDALQGSTFIVDAGYGFQPLFCLRSTALLPA